MNFLHSGCCGDVIYSLPSIKSLGGGSIYFADRPWTKPIVNRLGTLTRLLESQDYISRVGVHNGERIDVDISTYRNGGQIFGDPIPYRVARWVRASIDLSTPWIQIEADPKTKDRIVINRCPRWHGIAFPWKQIVEFFGSDLLFIGLPEEHRDFCQMFGPVDFYPTSDLYDAARAIKGSHLFIGNQSSCNSLAEAMLHPKVTEVCLTACDCLFPRKYASYSINGELKFSALGKEFSSPPLPVQRFVNRSISPQDGWRVTVGGKRYSGYDFSSVVREASMANPGLSGIPELIESQTIQEIPTLGLPGPILEQYGMIERVKSLLQSKRNGVQA